MGSAKVTKAADKALVCRKLTNALHKLYGRSVPKIELPVVETFLFAICLEDNQWAPAEAGLKKVLAAFFDMNEIRVSSVTELEQQLAPLRFSDWKGMRIRSTLRHIFETTYSYDFEKLRRQTMEQALKTLKKFTELTPFVRDFVLHEILGSHIVVLDTSMLNAARWLGLVPADDNHTDASEFLRGGIKKSEVSEFCHLLRCLATDPKFIPRFADTADLPLTMHDVMDRFVELQNPPKRKLKPPAPVAPVVSAKPAVPGAATSKTSATVAGKAPVAGTKLPAATPAKAVVPATMDSKHVAKPATTSKSSASAKITALPPARPLTTSTVASGKSHPVKPTAAKSAPVKEKSKQADRKPTTVAAKKPAPAKKTTSKTAAKHTKKK